MAKVLNRQFVTPYSASRCFFRIIFRVSDLLSLQSWFRFLNLRLNLFCFQLSNFRFLGVFWLWGLLTQNRFLAPNLIKTTLRSSIIEMLSKTKLGGLVELLGIMGRLGCFGLIGFFCKMWLISKLIGIKIPPLSKKHWPNFWEYFLF
jgi:hypothetical protein